MFKILFTVQGIFMNLNYYYFLKNESKLKFKGEKKSKVMKIKIKGTSMCDVLIWNYQKQDTGSAYAWPNPVRSGAFAIATCQP